MSLRAGESRYEARQALNRAMRHLRDAEDIARLKVGDGVFAGRVREIHEALTRDVLNGRRNERSTAWKARAWDRLRARSGDTPNVEPREGMVTVYGPDGSYLGCMGIERWARLLAEDAAVRSGGDTTTETT